MEYTTPFYLIISYLILFAAILLLIYTCYTFFKINIILGFLSIFILLLFILLFLYVIKYDK